MYKYCYSNEGAIYAKGLLMNENFSFDMLPISECNNGKKEIH